MERASVTGLRKACEIPKSFEARLEDERDFVDVAPRPVLARLGGLHDRMADGAKVRARVTVRRAVATADVAAALTHAQVQPPPADLQAVFAAGNRVRQLEHLDRVEVGAGSAHAVLRSKRQS